MGRDEHEPVAGRHQLTHGGIAELDGHRHGRVQRIDHGVAGRGDARRCHAFGEEVLS